MTRFLALMELAWKESRGDIHAALNLWIGSMIGLAAFGMFFLIHLGIDFKPAGAAWLPTAAQTLPTAISPVGAILISIIYAYVNTFSMFTFLIIVVCLFEYALAFCIVAYYYDGGSWFVVNAINGSARSVTNAFRSFRKEQDAKDRVRHELWKRKLVMQLEEIKKGDL